MLVSKEGDAETTVEINEVVSVHINNGTGIRIANVKRIRVHDLVVGRNTTRNACLRGGMEFCRFSGSSHILCELSLQYYFVLGGDNVSHDSTIYCKRVLVWGDK